MSAAMTLHVFDISAIPEEPPQFRYTDGTIRLGFSPLLLPTKLGASLTDGFHSHPEPFRCRIALRSKHAEELIKQVALEETMSMNT
jgi:hypothetical protein